MGFTTSCYIRKNTKELQNELEKLGYKICICANFENAIWLDTLTENGTVHGVGYTDETMPRTVEEECAIYEAETSDIDCGENELLFLFLAALRDDTDKDQVFVNGKGDWGIFRINEYNSGMEYFYLSKDMDENNYHKASAEEIIELFSK